MFSLVFFAKARAWSATCIASSRVGVRIKIRAGPGLLWNRFCLNFSWAFVAHLFNGFK